MGLIIIGSLFLNHGAINNQLSDADPHVFGLCAEAASGSHPLILLIIH